MSQIYVDPEQLRAYGEAFQEHGSRTKAILADLFAKLAAEGECWGEDGPGRKFAEQYVPTVQKLMTAGDQVTEAFNSTGSGLVGSALANQKAEEQNAATVAALLRRTEDSDPPPKVEDAALSVTKNFRRDLHVDPTSAAAAREKASFGGTQQPDNVGVSTVLQDWNASIGYNTEDEAAKLLETQYAGDSKSEEQAVVRALQRAADSLGEDAREPELSSRTRHEPENADH